jgi:hypothetical protein
VGGRKNKPSTYLITQMPSFLLTSLLLTIESLEFRSHGFVLPTTYLLPPTTCGGAKRAGASGADSRCAGSAYDL